MDGKTNTEMFKERTPNIGKPVFPLAVFAPALMRQKFTISSMGAFPKLFLPALFIMVVGLSSLEAQTLHATFTGSYGYTVIGNSETVDDWGSNFQQPTSAYLGLPGGTTVKAAYLYWATSGVNDPAVTLNGNTVNYQEGWWGSYVNGQPHTFYGYFADVTSLVGGSGNYTVDNLDWSNSWPYTASYTAFGNWSLVVVYEGASLPAKSLSVYKNWYLQWPSNVSHTFAGFQSSCSSSGKVTLIVHEGDGYKGEYLYVNGQYVGDNTLSGSTAANLDIDTYNVNLSSGQTSLGVSVTAYVQAGGAVEFLVVYGAVVETDASPVITSHPSPLSLCQGAPFGTMSVSAAGPGLTYQWWWSADNSNWNLAGNPGSTSPTITINNYNTPRYYRVVVTNASGCSTVSNSAAYTVFPTPSITSQPTGSTICTGGTATLSVGATGGTPSLGYQWQSSSDNVTFNNIAGATSSSYTTAALAATTYYRAVVSASGSGCGNVTSNSATVTVAAGPLANAGADVSICSGSSTTLTASGGTSYSWSNGLGSGATKTVTQVSTTTYTVTVTDVNGCTATDQVTVTVSGPCSEICDNGADDDGDGLIDCADPDCANFLNINTNVTSLSICVGESSTISASASGGAGPYTYIWDNGLGNGISHNISPNMTTTYTVTVTSGGGCTSTAQVTVVVNFCSEDCTDGIDNDGDGLVDCDDPGCGLGGSTNKIDAGCGVSNGSITITATGGSGSYEYSSNNTTWSSSNTFTNLAPGSYVFYARNANSECPRTFPFTIDQLCEICTDGIDNDGDGLIDCTDSDCSPTSSAGNSKSICNGTSTTLTAIASGGTSPYSFAWSNGLGSGASKTVTPASTTVYTVTVTSATGCSSTASVTVTVTACGENCIDGVDNDGDGLIDCADPDCSVTGAPVLVDDVFTSCPGVTYGNVVSMNDGNLQNPIFSITSPTTKGTIQINNFGVFTYDPNTNACTVDNFTYQVCNQTTGCCATATATINIGDTQPPVMLNVPADLTISCDDEIPVPPIIFALDACPGIYVSLEEADDFANSGTCGTYTITRTWTATDLCGNSSSDSQLVVVQDEVKPELFRLYTLPNGKKMAAGIAKNTSHLWKYVKFPVHFNTPPVVLATLTSSNDASAASVQVRYVSKSGFEVRLMEEEGSDRLHGKESVSWTAIEKGSSTGASQILVDIIPSVNQTEKSQSYAMPFTAPPAFIAQPQTTNEEDAVTIRTNSETSAGVKFFLQEEQSKGTEINHMDENIGYIALLGDSYLTDSTGIFFGESGKATVDHNWKTISLANRYTKPVVIFGGVPSANLQAANVRVRNVTPNSFEVRVQEWDYLDGLHPDEELGYIVVEGSIPLEQDLYCFNETAKLQPGVNLFAIDNCDDQVAFGYTESETMIAEGLQTSRAWVAVDDCGNVILASRNDTCRVAAVRLKALLSGALIGTQPGSPMRDDLRSHQYLPELEPYSDMQGFQHKSKGGGETASQSIFHVLGNNAVTDWVFLEIRDAADPKTVLATTSALVQRDGDVISADGGETIIFPTQPEGDYVVSIRHRNHLGMATADPWFLTTDGPPLVDFNSPSLGVRGGSVAGKTTGSGGKSLWAGDINGDRRAIYQGPNNDIFALFSQVVANPDNTENLANYIVTGYNRPDVNLDGKTIYQGPMNDRAFLLLNSVLSHPLNTGYLANFIAIEHLP